MLLEKPLNIAGIDLLSGLSEQEKQVLIGGGRSRQCHRGQLLFAHNEPVTHFYIITKGTFQLARTSPDGHEKTIEVLKAGQTMCEGEILDSCRSHRMNAMAIDDSSVLEFTVSWLKDAAKKNSAFALNLLAQISHRAHMAELEAEQQTTMSAAQLVACFIQRLCVLYDFSLSGFDLPYSKTVIASRLGMQSETFSRSLSKIKGHGISVEGARVVIHDLKRIEDYVCSMCSISGNCPTHTAIEQKARTDKPAY